MTDEQWTRLFETLDEDMEMEMLRDAKLPALDGTSTLQCAKNIEAKTFSKLGLTTSATEIVPVQRFRRRRLVSWVAAIVAIVLTVVVSVPGPASAALQKWFQFIPGIGTVQQTDGQSGALVLDHPVQAKTQFGNVTVMGAMMTPTEVYVKMNGPGFEMPHRVSMQMVNGQILHLGYSGVSSDAQWSGDYTAQVKLGTIPAQEKVVIHVGSGWNATIPLTLKEAKTVADMAKLGPTDAHQGIVMTAVTQQNGKQTTLTFLSQYHGPYHIWDYAPYVTSSESGVEIEDASGHTYAAKAVFGTSPNNEFSFQPAKGIQDYTVTIPQVEAEYDGTANVRLPVPLGGSVRMNKTVKLGGFPITFVSAERIHDKNNPSASVRYDLRMNRDSAANHILHGFQLHVGFDAKLNLQSGVFEWIELLAQPQQKFMTLHMTEPQVYIRGPWQFHIHIPSS